MDLFGVGLWFFLEWSHVDNSRKAEKSYMLYVDSLHPGRERLHFFSLDACRDFLLFTFFWRKQQLETGCWAGVDVSGSNERHSSIGTPFLHAQNESIHHFWILENSFQVSSEEHHDMLLDIFILWDAEKYFIVCSTYCFIDSGLTIYFLIAISLCGTIYVKDSVPVFSETQPANQGSKYQ